MAREMLAAYSMLQLGELRGQWDIANSLPTYWTAKAEPACGRLAGGA